MTKITTPDTADLLARIASRENGYAMSLRQQAAWVREAVDPASDETQRIELQDIDTDELDAAASEIDALMALVATLEAEVADLSEAPQNTMGKPEFVMKVAERFKARAQIAEAALDEIIMEATSRNHAIDIARRARAEGE